MFRHPDERIVVPGRRMPHQVIVLAFTVLAGVTFVFRQAPAPNSLERLLDTRVLWVWYLLLFVGGVVGLVGSFARTRPYQGLLAERASMILLTTATLMYAVAMIAAAGVAATGAAMYILGWAASCAWRVWDIQKDLRVLRNLPPPAAADAGGDR